MTRRGMTLVELLVVISIMVALLAFAVPRIALDRTERRIRAASDIVVAALNTARYRAIETGRPCGVLFEEDLDWEGSCRVLKQVEVPPPFAGLSYDSKMQLTNIPSTDGHAWYKATVSFDDIGQDLVSSGDRIQFNHKGHWYRIHSKTDNKTAMTSDLVFISVLPVPHVPPFPYPVEYSIQTRPTVTYDPPSVLPDGAAVDLVASGFAEKLFDVGGSITILFNPNGEVQSLYYLDPTGRKQERIQSPIYLLVGQSANVPKPFPPAEVGRVFGKAKPDVEEEKKPNWQILKSRWVQILPSSGDVKAALNAATPNWDKLMADGEEAPVETGIRESRTFAAE
jgi:prepilin-type N-terminal cleavage/methylation domain-containing protein